jgi:hypothetical protein
VAHGTRLTANGPFKLSMRFSTRWRTSWRNVRNIQRDAGRDFPVHVILHSVEPDSVPASKGVILLFHRASFCADDVVFPKWFSSPHRSLFQVLTGMVIRSDIQLSYALFLERGEYSIHLYDGEREGVRDAGGCREATPKVAYRRPPKLGKVQGAHHPCPTYGVG